MFALKGQKWRTMRNKISPTFTSGKMKMMFQTLVKTGEELRRVFAEEMKKDEIIGAKDLLARFTTDIIGSCAFGLDCNSLKDPNTDFRKYGQRFLDKVLSNTLLLVFGFIAPSLLTAFNVTVSDKKCSEFFLKVLNDTIEYREKNEVHRKDFMDLFIRLKNNENIQDENLIPDSKFNKNSNEGITFLGTYRFPRSIVEVFTIMDFQTWRHKPLSSSSPGSKPARPQLPSAC